MPDKGKAALWAALPALAIALTGWLQAQTAATKAKQAKAGLGDNYQGYVEDRMRRDEALQAAIDRLRLELAYCEMTLSREMPTKSKSTGSIVAQIGVEPVDLDELAKAEGYAFKR